MSFWKEPAIAFRYRFSLKVTICLTRRCANMHSVCTKTVNTRGNRANLRVASFRFWAIWQRSKFAELIQRRVKPSWTTLNCKRQTVAQPVDLLLGLNNVHVPKVIWASSVSLAPLDIVIVRHVVDHSCHVFRAIAINTLKSVTRKRDDAFANITLPAIRAISAQKDSTETRWVVPPMIVNGVHVRITALACKCQTNRLSVWNVRKAILVRRKSQIHGENLILMNFLSDFQDPVANSALTVTTETQPVYLVQFNCVNRAIAMETSTRMPWVTAIEPPASAWNVFTTQTVRTANNVCRGTLVILSLCRTAIANNAHAIHRAQNKPTMAFQFAINWREIVAANQTLLDAIVMNAKTATSTLCRAMDARAATAIRWEVSTHLANDSPVNAIANQASLGTIPHLFSPLYRI